MKGIDCTTKINESIGTQLKAAGIQFICRYLVPQRLEWKRLASSEVQILTNLGMYVVSVFETTEDRVKGGTTAGMVDGREAKEEAIIVNQPKGSTIYFAVDYEATCKDFDTIESYLKAAAQQLPGFKVGVYGSYAVIEEMAKRKACDCFWQTYAWSAGKLSKYANIYQNKNGVTMAGIQCDLNDSYGNEGGWNYMPEVQTWEEILNKYASNPAGWKEAIDTAVNAAKANGNLGALEIFKFLPELIEKVYKRGA